MNPLAFRRSLQAKPSGGLLQQAGVRREGSRLASGLLDDSTKWAPSRLLEVLKGVAWIGGEVFRRL